MTALIPDGLEPLAVWDTYDPDGWWRCGWSDERAMLMIEASDWAQPRIERAIDTLRVEFYLLDMPFAKVWRHRRDEDGHLVWNLETHRPHEEDPVIVPLAGLPPAHLLGPACGQCGRTGTASRDVTGTSTLYSWPYDGAERYVCRGPCLETEG